MLADREMFLLAKVCCLAGLILLIVLFQEIVGHQLLLLYMTLMRTGSCWLRLPPTSRMLITLSSLLIVATLVELLVVEDAVLVTCTGTSTTLFQLTDLLRLAYIRLIRLEMLLNV